MRESASRLCGTLQMSVHPPERRSLGLTLNLSTTAVAVVVAPESD